jgi:putative SOS response-associated peptidase YedK
MVPHPQVILVGGSHVSVVRDTIVPMCGRYASTKDPATLAAEFDAVDATEGEAPGADYNVAPTDPVLAVVQRHPRDAEGTPDPKTTVRSVRVMRWGLLPGWSKDRSSGAKMINARYESVATKPAFKKALATKRCLVPADGWFEWLREGTAKQPYFMTRRDGLSIAMAGLWAVWHDPAAKDAPPVISCTVLTTESAGPLARIHDRMPMLMAPDRWAQWLDPDRDDVTDLLERTPDPMLAALELRPVSTKVNSVKNDGPELLEEVRPDPDEVALFDLDEVRNPA